ncbi:MAG: LysM peptidoglycan-binding domain-containing protein [Bacilli bacterium]|nr:LysM peptidoglycan-binding domain-containing protein [Bacilli bacterium]
MKSVIPYEKDIKFDTKIAEITSISLEHEEQLNNGEIDGTFIISGDYKAHLISVNKENFTYKIPFTIELTDNIDKDSVIVDINDFTYDIKDNDTLTVKIELLFSYEEIIKEDIIENKEEESVDDNILKEQRNEELDKEIDAIINNNEEKNVESSIIDNSITTTDNTYVTYHVYIVTKEDTIDLICQKFKVSKELLHEYNDFDEIKIGDKLLIPIEEDE